MARQQSKRDTGIGASLIVSTVIHLTVFLLLFWWNTRFPATMAVESTYYVDIINLPVASPQAGSPTQQGSTAEAPPPPLPDNSMIAPAAPKPKPSQAQTQKPVAKSAAAAPESDAFAEKMAKLEGSVESRQQAAALERLRRKMSTPGSGKAGMPAGTGTQSGSDYTAYIQSRLKDAFRDTITYSSKNPEMVIQLQIDSSGKLSRRKTERSSGDRSFELAVMRAIDIASEKFTPPPGRTAFEGAFVFRPQGISNQKP